MRHAEPIIHTRPDQAWYAVSLRSHCEHLVARQLTEKGFDTFLPELSVWSKRPGPKHAIRTPMFAGHLFVRDALDKRRYLDLLKVRGVVRVLETGWSRLTPIPDDEIDAIRRVAQADVPVSPHAHVRHGDHVRVIEGPLAGLEGLFVRDTPSKGRLVLSVNVMKRSVAVDMDSTEVETCA